MTKRPKMHNTQFTREAFARALLDDLGLEERKHRMLALVAWMSLENTDARFNPLATTQKMPGSEDFSDENDPPVQDYVSFLQGVSATVMTLENGSYYRVLDALRDAERAREITVAIARSPWNKSETYRERLLATLKTVEGDYNKYANEEIGQ